MIIQKPTASIGCKSYEDYLSSLTSAHDELDWVKEMVRFTIGSSKYHFLLKQSYLYRHLNCLYVLEKEPEGGALL